MAGESAIRIEPGEIEDRERLFDVSAMTAMTLVLLGNYSQTGHFGGPLSATPYVVATHLGGPENGGLVYDLREPKHPLADRFMLSGGHNIPACYALWMVLYESLLRHGRAGVGRSVSFDPTEAILPVDAIGFRRSRDALDGLLEEHGLERHPLFAAAKDRGIRALAGHSESTDVTNDVNGGPSGIGIATAVGKAMFWDLVGAPSDRKVIAIEGEFAMTEGHAQEIKTAAVAQRVGKRLRILLSMNNAGIDDSLIGGIVKSEYSDYDIEDQWLSYGWNVLTLDDGNDLGEILTATRIMEEWPVKDRRPMIVIGRTLKGWWPFAEKGKIPGAGRQLTGHESHPYALPMNGKYFVALAKTFEKRYGVKFQGIRNGPPATETDRLVEFMTNVNVVMNVMDEVPGLRAWIAERILGIADRLDRKATVGIDRHRDPFRDDLLRPENLPVDPVEVVVTNPHSGDEVNARIRLFAPAGETAGARRAVSEIGKWMNHVTGGRFLTVAADLSSSINVEDCHFFGHYDPVRNPAGTRLKAPITEAVNAATIAGAASMNLAAERGKFAGYWGLTGTYGAFTPLMYTPARVFSQQKQDSPFPVGVMTVLAGHSGPETAADARTHFGIFAPQVWTLFPRGQVVNLYFWDYNDVAPGYFAAVTHAARTPAVGILVIHVARPDTPVADRELFADKDLRAASKGIYLIRDFAADAAPMGTVWAQGASSTQNLVALLPRLDEEGINVRVAAVISEELFALQPAAYRHEILPDRARVDSMVVSTMTRRVPPLAGLGPLTDEYSLYADHDDRWRTGGTEDDLIHEAGLDPDSILAGVRRFAGEREDRLARQRAALA